MDGGGDFGQKRKQGCFFAPFFFDDALFEFWNQMFSDSPGFSDRIDGFEVFDSYMDDAQAWVMKNVEHHH